MRVRALLLACCLVGCGSEGGSIGPDEQLVDTGLEAVVVRTIDEVSLKVQPSSVSGDSLANLVIFITHDCPIANQYVPEMRSLEADHPSVRQILVHVDPDASSEDLRQHRADYELPGTVVHDPKHELVAAFGATVTPEAFLVDRTGRVVYRGRIDDLYPELGTKRRQARERDLREAIAALERGEQIEAGETVAIGCRIPELPPDSDR